MSWLIFQRMRRRRSQCRRSMLCSTIDRRVPSALSMNVRRVWLVRRLWCGVGPSVSRARTVWFGWSHNPRTE